MAMKFNPDKCPYRQLMKTEQGAIVFVEHRYTTSKDDPDYARVRYVAREQVESNSYFMGHIPRAGHVMYRNLSAEVGGFLRSCFSSYVGFKASITGMKEYDRENDLKIVFIEFVE